MNILRTPDEHFADLPDFPYAAKYAEDLEGLPGLRMAYLDEGPEDADQTFLCLHGQPTWSFLYRKMLPVFVEAGGRVIAPDFFGFGRSDKPDEDDWYTFGRHRSSLVELVRSLDLSGVTLVVQDWGGVLGLTLPVEDDIRARIERVIVMNTALATGQSAGPGFDAWRDYVASTEDLPIGELMGRAEPSLTQAEADAYEAPYPDKTYKAGVRRFPQLVMTEPDMEGVEVSRQAARFWSEDWAGQSFMAVGEKDPVLGPPIMKRMRELLRGCPEPLMLPEAGHFVQEQGEQVARAALASFDG